MKENMVGRSFGSSDQAVVLLPIKRGRQSGIRGHLIGSLLYFIPAKRVFNLE